ncbi:integral membrane protein [Stackebrandtia albiflava]|uniref:Integral membrane protein n=1 Tax=Stackebrandtia albiflava TaxID=406432 RepID=A0A562VGV8_9ACTN|nr:DUF3817 domain-containing protein [Stackebrandtia albiflava]TWJ17108.1 integral membrane protein [Stackebrandtia albiflava]
MPVLYRVFFAVALAEAGSWIGLLAGMWVKYLGSGAELGVQIFGPVHGGLFMLYGGLVVLLAIRERWSWRTVLLGLACSIPPLASIWFERRIARDKDAAPVPA